MVKEAPFGKRYGCAVLAFGDKLWLFGGATQEESNPPEKHYKQFTTHNDAWCSPDGVNWTRAVEHAPWEERQWVVGQVYGGRMFIIGGFSNRRSVNFDDVWSTTDGVAWERLDTATRFSPRHEVTSYGLRRQPMGDRREYVAPDERCLEAGAAQARGIGQPRTQLDRRSSRCAEASR